MDVSRNDLLGTLAQDADLERTDFLVQATEQLRRFLDANRDRIDASVVWTVGALFDYVADRVPRAPHWLSDNGLEWICRLAVEPRRMWRRYLLGNPAFLYRVLHERRRRRNGA